MKAPAGVTILNYEKPTVGEVGEVMAYWAAVEYQVYRDHAAAPKHTPSPELMHRVALHQQWQKAILCHHPSITMTYGANGPGMVCSECDRPMEMLSDVQIQKIRRGED